MQNKKSSIMEILPYKWLAAMFGAVSLFSFAETVWKFGLGPVFNDLIEFYRSFAGIVFGWLWWLLPFDVDQWYKDLVGLTLVLSVCMARALMLHESEEAIVLEASHLTNYDALPLKSQIIFHFLFSIVIFVTWGLTLLIVPYSLYVAISLWTFFLDEDKMSSPDFKDHLVRKEILRILCISVLFFALNAYGVSVS